MAGMTEIPDPDRASEADLAATFIEAADRLLAAESLDPENEAAASGVQQLLSLALYTTDRRHLRRLPRRRDVAARAEALRARLPRALEAMELWYARELLARRDKPGGIEVKDFAGYPLFPLMPAWFEAELGLLAQGLARVDPGLPLAYAGPGALPVMALWTARRTGRRVLALCPPGEAGEACARLIDAMGVGAEVEPCAIPAEGGDGAALDALPRFGALIVSHRLAGAAGIVTRLAARPAVAAVVARRPRGLTGLLFPDFDPDLLKIQGCRPAGRAETGGGQLFDPLLMRRRHAA